MKVVCAWCNTCIDDGCAENNDHTSVSHGICEACLPGMVENMAVPMDDFLDAWHRRSSFCSVTDAF